MTFLDNLYEKDSENAQNPQLPGSNTPGNPPIPADCTWYVSQGGNDAASGTAAAQPLATVSKALDKIKALYRSGKWPSGASARIVISGTIKGSGKYSNATGSMIEVS
ncbi:MAG: hypothetical protein LBH50_02240, partial [Spirochaetaceae bacterium]|nr:hypothetical protein [Spirochaetaceae bacterium]